MTTYQRRPVRVEAVQWQGSNADELNRFAGPNFTVIDEDDRPHTDDPEATAELFDTANWRRVLMYTGDWVVKEGEQFSRVSAYEFAAEYEPAEGAA